MSQHDHVDQQAQSISDLLYCDVSARLDAITAMQIRIKLTCKFRTAIYPNDESGQYASAQITNDFNLCARLGTPLADCVNTAHELDQSTGKDERYDAQYVLSADTHLQTAKMLYDLNATLMQPDKYADEIDTFALSSVFTENPAQSFLDQGRLLIIALHNLDGILDEEIKLGSTIGQWAQIEKDGLAPFIATGAPTPPSA